jgi:3-hydroxyisobutyrate dehydrogenase-like beta-hydroxyacid dehydrogenase
MSPTGAEFTRSAAARLGELGIGVVEASVVEGIGGAPATLLVGCDANDLPNLAPVLRAGAGHVVRGDGGGRGRDASADGGAVRTVVRGARPRGRTGTGPR